MGVPATRAHAEASSISQSQSASSSAAAIPRFIRLDFAYATRSVLYVMAGIMAVAAIVALNGLRAGLQEETAGEVGSATAVEVEPDTAVADTT